MLFNSLSFAIFLPIVYLLYWFVVHKKLISQNLLLLFSSYYFYSCWDWRFSFLLLFSTLLDYYSGIKIANSQTQTVKKKWFWLSVSVNLGFLAVFKYYNFFIESLDSSLQLLGLQSNLNTLNVILPVGISFYTFHGLSYVIDIYKNRIEPEKNFIDYALFVSFFPLLVAGPIERATHLLPQLKIKRNFNYNNTIIGLRQILWGLFKKIVIADQCAEYANLIFTNYSDYSGSTLLFGGILFAFQIYGDFSGYSDIALGTAKLFGINLLKNFSYPYFSRDIAEFWRRWHISLSSWFKDYLYIPLGGSKGNLWTKIRNTFIIFIVSGFWHGANWTFIFWGLLNALFIMPSILFHTNRNNLEIVAKGRLFPTYKELISILVTFFLTVLAWIFFRAENLTKAFSYLKIMFSTSFFSIPHFPGIGLTPFLMCMILFLVFLEWIGRENNFAIENFSSRFNRFSRWNFYLILIILIIYYSGSEQEFIYFQF